MRSYRYRLYPNAEQVAVLREWAGAARFIYNIALEQRRDWWRQYRAIHGRSISFASQSREVTDLRREAAWLAAVPRSVCEQALKDLDRAFNAFFRGAGFPRFRSKERICSFRVQGREARVSQLNAKWASLRVPNGLRIKMRVTRRIVGEFQAVTVTESGGKWFVALVTSDALATPPGESGAVGIDRGIANTLSLSDGRHFTMPAHVKNDRTARAAQRSLSRCTKFSKRRAKAMVRASRARQKLAAARRHWLHERTTSLAREFRTVALESLTIANMTRSGSGKRGINRSILEQGWALFATLLEYKLAARGGQVFYVNPAYTSQTCSDCGSVNSESRKSQAVFHCVDCGHRAHADTNAAINILRRSPAGVEGVGYGPVEARTGEMLTHLKNLAA